MGRATVAAVVWFAAGALVGFLAAGTCATARPSAEPASTPDAARSAPRDGTDAEPRGSRTRARAGPDATQSPDDAEPRTAIVLPPRGDADPEVREVAVPGGPTGWAILEVEVTDSEGAPLRGESVVAIPTRAPFDSRDEYGGFPNADTGADGVARLKVPSPGRYDVVTHGMPFHLRRGDLPVPATTRVTLRDPPRETIRVVLADDLAAGEEFVVPTAHAVEGVAAAPDGTLVVAEPGNGWNCTLSRDRRTGDIAVPAALRWRVVLDAPWSCDPAVVVPPAEVRVRRNRTEELVVLATLHGETSPEAVERLIEFAWEVPCGRVLCLDEVQPGESLDGRCLERRLAVTAARGVLRWSGPEIESGSVEYDLSAQRLVRIDLQHIAPATVPSPVFLRSDEVPEGTEVASVLARPDSDGATTEARLVAGAETRLPAAGAWLLAVPPVPKDAPVRDLVGGPVRLVAGVRTELRVRRGGFVLPFLKRRPPDGTGVVEIARADGAPLADTHVDNSPAHDPDVAFRVEVGPNTLLGPFEPGPVVLDVLLGRALFRRVEVLVSEGETTALPLGPFGEAAR